MALFTPPDQLEHITTLQRIADPMLKKEIRDGLVVQEHLCYCDEFARKKQGKHGVVRADANGGGFEVFERGCVSTSQWRYS